METLTMHSTPFRKPIHPNTDLPGEFEPGTLPVEPDQGPIPPFVPPEDPEHDRIVDPPASPSPVAVRTRGQGRPGACA
jgi:hypothetical protein